MKIKKSHMKEQARQVVLDYIVSRENLVDYEIQNIIPNLYDTKSPNLLKAVYNNFKGETNIPVSIPMFSLFSYLANFLVRNKSTWTIPGRISKQRANLWLINLAPSGASKTFSLSMIENVIPENEKGEKVVSRNFDHCAGSKAFMQELKDKNNGFYCIDEAAKTLASIEQEGSPLSETKELYLKMYDGKELVRKNAQETIRIEEPCLTLLWLNTIQNFIDKISYESLADGFAQRFLYVITERDLTRNAGDYGLYPNETITQNIKSEAESVFNQQVYEEYIINEDVRDMYLENFKRLWGEINLCESFFRRILFSSFTYAIIYHLLFKKSGNEIDREDLDYGLRVCVIHLHSIKRLVHIKAREDEGLNELKRVVEKVLERDSAGKSIKPRDLVSGVRGVDSKDDADFILELIKEAKTHQMSCDPMKAFNVQ